jgi:hypothetical protein
MTKAELEKDCGNTATQKLEEIRKAKLKELKLDYSRFLEEIKRGLEAPNIQTMKIRGAVKGSKTLKVLCTSGELVHTKLGEVYADGDSIVTWREEGPAPGHSKYVEMLGKIGKYFPDENHTFSNPDGTPLELSVTFVKPGANAKG